MLLQSVRSLRINRRMAHISVATAKSCGGTRPKAATWPGGTDHQGDGAEQAEGSDALALANDGASARGACEHGAAHLAGAWVTAAPPGDLQALAGPQLCVNPPRN